MNYLNIHTHQPLHDGELTLPSFGLHPWLVEADWHQRLRAIDFPPQDSSDRWMVGECGLDRLYPATYQLQLQAFEAQIELSESLCRPMIVHCVRAWDDLLRLHRRASQPWIVHGFRGRPQLLAQLLDGGFYVSFGFRHNAASLAACQPTRLFLETDNTPLPIAPLYDETAAALGIDLDTLCWQTMHNLQQIFEP